MNKQLIDRLVTKKDERDEADYVKRFMEVC